MTDNNAMPSPLKGPNADKPLAGKTCLVTGASRGLGVVIAEHLAAAGANLAIGARDLLGLTATGDRLKRAGTSCLAIPLDMTNGDSAQAFVETAKAHFGQIDVLVNNAGMLQPIDHFDKASPDQWLANLHTNIDGMFHVSRAALPHLLGCKGALLTVSSGMALRAVPGYSAYCSAKAAMAMLSQSLDAEYRDKGLRVFSFQPGRVDTDMQADIRRSEFPLPPVSSGPAYAPAEEPATIIRWLVGQYDMAWCGKELSLRDPALRKAAGLSVE